jgi:hypothetical protein
MRPLRPAGLAFICALAAALGCGNATPGGSGGAGGKAATATTGDNTEISTTTGGGGAGGMPAPIKNCNEIGATACFSSFDCAADTDRCQNRGTADLAVPCCVKGARGTGKVGEACVGENDCKSALCIQGDTGTLCSDKCISDSECPASLPKCIAIAFSGSADMFCTP